VGIHRDGRAERRKRKGQKCQTRVAKHDRMHENKRERVGKHGEKEIVGRKAGKE
jgi:hypothetical protein